MVFCNFICITADNAVFKVTILILIDGFLQFTQQTAMDEAHDVTILILIDGFLQLNVLKWEH